MRPMFYILKGRNVVPVEPQTWAEWFEQFEHRHVADDWIGDVRVSTIFIGLDHNYAATGPPLIFETMVFGGPLNGEGKRYASYEEAEAGHTAMLQRIADEEGTA